jgi:glycosyltransferase involved in cell wall biosynthesis
VGLYIAKKYKVKWVATWNDPYIYEKYPIPYKYGPNAKVSWIRERLINDISKHTFKNVFPSVRLRDYMLQYMKGMKKEDCVVIPHIVSKYISYKEQKEYGTTLRVVHTGRVELARNPASFCRGLKIFLNKFPDAKIKFVFIGAFELLHNNKSFEDLIQDYDLGRYIELRSPIPYLECLKYSLEFDVCMLLEAPCEEGIFLPSKIVDYWQCHKPILALSPKNGVIKDLKQANMVGYFADVTNAEDIANTIEVMCQDFNAKALHFADGNKILNYTEDAVINLHIANIFTQHPSL